MFSFWRMRRRWPPPPSVEDEVESLARELDDFPTLSEKPGLEGVRCRGTIDQCPILLAVDIPPSLPPTGNRATEVFNGSSDDSTGPPTPPLDVTEEPIFHSVNDFQFEPYSRPSDDSFVTEVRHKEKDASAGVDLSRGRPSGHQAQPGRPQRPQPLRDSSNANSSHKRAPSRHSASKIQEGTSIQYDTSFNPRVSSQSLEDRPVSSHSQSSGGLLAKTPTSRGRSDSVNYKGSIERPVVNKKVQDAPASSHIKPPGEIRDKSAPTYPKRRRSVSVRHESPIEHLVASQKPCVPSSGHVSDSTTTEHTANSDRVDRGRTTQVDEKVSIRPLKVPTLAERIDEKLRRRQELRDLENHSGKDEQKNHSASTEHPTAIRKERRASRTTEPLKTSMNATVPESTPQSPIRGLRSNAGSRTHSSDASSRPRAATSTPTNLQPGSASLDKNGPSSPAAATRSQSPPLPSENNTHSSKSSASKEVKTTASRRVRSQTVSLPHKELPKAVAPSSAKMELDRIQLRSPSWERNDISSQELVVHAPPPATENLCLLPCPRSVPMPGHQDWYTIKGMAYLDICPSCLKQLAQSKFRDFFIPSPLKPRNQKVRCSFSEPWTRLAWIQAIKEDHDDLKMLHQITRPPAAIKPCPGRIISEQYWYRIVDPETDMFLPKFSVCSACVRNLRILMPCHKETFKRSSTLRERVCDLATASPRFIQYIDLLDAAASRATTENSDPDTDDFLAYARRKVVLRDCRRDRLILSTWHYIPHLPELTVCEDCFDDVVWPLVKANYPIARMFSSSPRLLPGDGLHRCREASCQLYSPRMRVRFREAVLTDDFGYLQHVALRRYDAELRFRKHRRELLDDERRGYDRDVELRINGEKWKKWE